MRERTLLNSRVADFGMRWAGLPPEKLGFRPQMDTFIGFLAGNGPKELNKQGLAMQVGPRTEYWHRHEPGYTKADVRILKIVAHPDDTGLDSGAAFLAVNLGKVNGVKKTRFGVITATPGQKGVRRHEPDVSVDLDTPIDKIRIKEDIEGTRLLGADFVANLGFMDGDVPKDEKELEDRLFYYLTTLRPHVVSLADQNDYAHEDHIAVTRATIRALLRTGQKPIVIYNEFQNGNRELTPNHVAYRLTHEEYKAVSDAFFVHWSQTREKTEDIMELMDRPYRTADMLGLQIPIGVFRQDPRFSQEPFGNYLGDRVIPIPQAERDLQLFRERIARIVSTRIPRDPTLIFDAEPAEGEPQKLLQYGLALRNTHLIAPTVLRSIAELDQPYNVIVTQIDPDNAENPAFFAENDISLHAIAKSLVVKVNGSGQYATVVVPGNTRVDLNGLVSQHLGVRQVSLAPQIIAEAETGMEPGSISPFGLPKEWPIFVDGRLVQQIQIMTGSGKRNSKLVVPGTVIPDLPNVRVLEGLGV